MLQLSRQHEAYKYFHYQGSQQSGKREIQFHISEVSYSSDDSSNDDYDYDQIGKKRGKRLWKRPFAWMGLGYLIQSLSFGTSATKESCFCSIFLSKEVVEASKDIEDLKKVKEALGEDGAEFAISLVPIRGEREVKKTA